MFTWKVVDNVLLEFWEVLKLDIIWENVNQHVHIYMHIYMTRELVRIGLSNCPSRPSKGKSEVLQLACSFQQDTCLLRHQDIKQ